MPRAFARALVALLALPLVIGAQQAAPAGYPGQSNTVPAGFPTPNTAYEPLQPGGPARDPGPLAWARPGPYIAPGWSDFTNQTFPAFPTLAPPYGFYWPDL